MLLLTQPTHKLAVATKVLVSEFSHKNEMGVITAIEQAPQVGNMFDMLYTVRMEHTGQLAVFFADELSIVA